MCCILKILLTFRNGICEEKAQRWDVCNFDVTAFRFHEASGNVIARKRTQIVRGGAFEGSLDRRLSSTFIPMVSCAGEKFDLAVRF